jgi:hypothetical protein
MLVPIPGVLVLMMDVLLHLEMQSDHKDSHRLHEIIGRV